LGSRHRRWDRRATSHDDQFLKETQTQLLKTQRKAKIENKTPKEKVMLK
jgi:hypothetical protein